MAPTVVPTPSDGILSPSSVLRHECLRRGPLTAGLGLGATLGLLVTLAVFLALRPPEPPPPPQDPSTVTEPQAPTAQGQTASPQPDLTRMSLAALGECAHQGTPAVRRAVALELGRRGPAARPAFPTLYGLLLSGDAELAAVAEQSLRATEPPSRDELDLLRAGLGDRRPEARRYCLHALKVLGPEASPAAPDLVLVLKSDDGLDQTDARDVLVALGPALADQLPDLLGLLTDSRPEVQAGALEVLAAIKPLRDTDVPVVVKALESPEAAVREYALSVVADLGPRAAPAVDRLAVLVASGNEGERRRAAQALAKIGPSARAARLALMGVLGERDEELVKAAADALTQIGPWTVVDLPVLRQGMSHASPRVRTIAARAVQPLGRAARPAVPELTKLLEDREAEVRLTALRSLAAVGPDAHAALPAVVKLLETAEGDHLSQGALCLAALGNAQTEEVPLLRPLLEDSRPPVVRASAALSLSRVKGEDGAVLTAVGLLAEPDAAVRGIALKAVQAQPADDLARLAPQLKGEVGRLKSGLLAEEPAVRFLTLKVLGHLGDDAAEVAVAVLELSEREKGPGRTSALETLAKVGAKQPAVHKALIERLGRGGMPQEAAIETLALLGKPTAPALAQALSDRNPLVRLGAARALERIGPPARADALAEVTARLRVQDQPEIKEALRRAFVRLQQKQ